MNLILVLGDITTQKVDAIVNPANSQLLGGGGADGAIHLAAGKELLEACRRIKKTELKNTQGLLPTGQAVITEGYRLPAKYVIHTVGPIYQSDSNPKESLRQAYTNCLSLAESCGIRTLAFPSISTGTYGFPIEPAAEIALRTVVAYPKIRSFEEIRFVLYLQRDYDIYHKTLKRLEK